MIVWILAAALQAARQRPRVFAVCLLALPLESSHASGRLFMLLDELEEQSIYILRETFSKFERLSMLWSIGDDSTMLLWLAREAFFGHAPFALAQVDTRCQTKERCFTRHDGYL
jgi:3'-phosphoadenosine 5'-phosphosulfate sulfotransferase (PAPS reductase)/FAD synthetase